MVDLGATISPKSDQLNSDDLIGGPMTIKITKVSASPSSPEQPVNIHYEGDNGKPYKACKSMRRVLVQAWGRDGSKYVGRSMTLYRDPKVMFGGIAVGGIRISHMSHIDGEMTMALTATRGSRKPYTVKPLKVTEAPDNWTLNEQMYNECESLEKLDELEQLRQRVWDKLPKEVKPAYKAAADAARARLTPPTTDNDREL